MRTLKREQAIGDIRRSLLALVDDEHSICQVATERNIFCRGFRRLSDAELARRYDWIVKRSGVTTRAELEQRANRWQLARQRAEDEELACDVQLHDRDTCIGWDEFSNERLELYYDELCGEHVHVV
jgi:hypothetical protein